MSFSVFLSSESQCNFFFCWQNESFLWALLEEKSWEMWEVLTLQMISGLWWAKEGELGNDFPEVVQQTATALKLIIYKWWKPFEGTKLKQFIRVGTWLIYFFGNNSVCFVLRRKAENRTLTANCWYKSLIFLTSPVKIMTWQTKTPLKSLGWLIFFFLIYIACVVFFPPRVLRREVPGYISYYSWLHTKGTAGHPK